MSDEIWEHRPKGLTDSELIAWALTEVAYAIHRHYHWLGTTNAATPMGALELMSKAIVDGCDTISTALELTSANISEALSERNTP